MPSGPYLGKPAVPYVEGAKTGNCCIDPGTPTAAFPCEQPVIFGYYMPGICMTLMFFMITGMDWGALGADEMTYHGGTGTALKAKGFLLFAVLIGLGCLTGAVYVLVDTYTDGHPTDPALYVVTSAAPGIALFMQNILIFVAAWVMRMGTINMD